MIGPKMQPLLQYSSLIAVEILGFPFTSSNILYLIFFQFLLYDMLGGENSCEIRRILQLRPSPYSNTI